MARGITENDVWTASDALLLEGARPTIERVRQKIGRGSPNTVSPLLDTWFKNLGVRIKDPGAFAAPADIPDPVMQAAKHFWEVAQAESRRDVDVRIREGLAAAVANVEAAKERARIAEGAAFDVSSKYAHAQSELEELRAELRRSQLAAATSEGRLQEARTLVDDLRRRLQEAETEVTKARESAQQEVATAQERAAAVERRALLDMDAERTARGKSDKRAEALEGRLQAVTSQAQAAQAHHAEQSATARAEIARLSAALASSGADAEAQRRQLVALTRELEEARGQARAASSQADLADRVIAAFKATAPHATGAKRAHRRTPRA